MKNDKEFNLIVFVALMGSSAVALSTKLIFNEDVLTDMFSYVLEVSIIVVFCVFFLRFLFHIFKKKRFFENLKNPLKSSLYSAVPISAALISLMLISIGLPFFEEYVPYVSVVFWFISLLFSLIFVVLVPINLKFRSKVEHVSGTWFLPPVGLFVLITAGSTLALKTSFFPVSLILINLLLLGPAFILYFLTLTLVYFRSKFYDLSKRETAPVFNIVLAPVGVSILAMVTTSKALLRYDVLNIGSLFSGISRIYSLSMFGYGLWISFGLMSLYYRVIKEKKEIPFSELWWAFIFPVGAFTLAAVNIYSYMSTLTFFKTLYLLLYLILVTLWVYVLLKQGFSSRSTKKTEG